MITSGQKLEDFLYTPSVSSFCPLAAPALYMSEI